MTSNPSFVISEVSLAIRNFPKLKTGFSPSFMKKSNFLPFVFSIFIFKLFLDELDELIFYIWALLLFFVLSER